MPERRGGARGSKRAGGSRGSKSSGGSRGNDRRGNGAGRDGARARPRLRPFWSGVITFGLVSVPVELYAANRSAGVSLRMVAPDGTPVKRQYWCPAHERDVSMDEIVRGYEVDEGEFVTVRDEELERLEPEKSREIDLRRFVDVSELDPAFYQRAYFLAPGGDTTKAYRLLADTMERTGRAGIATFVMRGREYLVAIISERGILRAETMRFHDELRSPEDVGLPEPGRSKTDRKLVSRLERAIEGHLEEGLDPAEMEDRYAERIEALVERKVRAGKDVAARPADAPEPEEGDTQVIDILAALRAKMRAASAGETGGGRSGRSAGGRRGGGRARGERPRGERRRGSQGGRERETAVAPSGRTKEELYERAKELDIPGRSRMTKEELAEAIRRSG